MELFFTDLLHSCRHSGNGRHCILGDPEWLSGFLNRWGFGELKLSDEDISALANLRDAILNVLENYEKDLAPEQKDLDTIHSALDGAQMKHELSSSEDGYKLTLKPVENGFAWMMHEIAASFAEVLTSGELCRIKFCDDDNCRWVFYDESKNCTRRWCCDTCGTRIKVRECRKRKKEEGEKE